MPLSVQWIRCVVYEGLPGFKEQSRGKDGQYSITLVVLFVVLFFGHHVVLFVLKVNFNDNIHNLFCFICGHCCVCRLCLVNLCSVHIRNRKMGSANVIPQQLH